jgi:hypothetical protein
MLRPFAVLAILSLSGCGSRAPKAKPGDLDAVWRGTESGRFIAPLVATHCAESGLVELIALRGDTGIGMALFLRDSAKIDPVSYPVLPGSLLQEPRPGATVGARWFATTNIAAFEGVAGKVQLEGTGGMLAGTIDAKFQALDRPDTFRLRGTFSQVRVVQADSGCRLIRKRNRM